MPASGWGGGGGAAGGVARGGEENAGAGAGVGAGERAGCSRPSERSTGCMEAGEGFGASEIFGASPGMLPPALSMTLLYFCMVSWLPNARCCFSVRSFVKSGSVSQSSSDMVPTLLQCSSRESRHNTTFQPGWWLFGTYFYGKPIP